MGIYTLFVNAVSMVLKCWVGLTPELHPFLLTSCVEGTGGKYDQLQPLWESVGSLISPEISESDQAQREFSMKS